MIPNNLEHIEAAQMEMNGFKKSWVEKHPEIAEKMKVVDSVCQELSAADIPFLLFSYSDQKSGFWQHNNFTGYTKTDEKSSISSIEKDGDNLALRLSMMLVKYIIEISAWGAKREEIYQKVHYWLDYYWVQLSNKASETQDRDAL